MSCVDLGLVRRQLKVVMHKDEAALKCGCSRSAGDHVVRLSKESQPQLHIINPYTLRQTSLLSPLSGT